MTKVKKCFVGPDTYTSESASVIRQRKIAVQDAQQKSDDAIAFQLRLLDGQIEFDMLMKEKKYHQAVIDFFNKAQKEEFIKKFIQNVPFDDRNEEAVQAWKESVKDCIRTTYASKLKQDTEWFNEKSDTANMMLKEL